MCLMKGISIQVMLLLVIPVPTALSGTACSDAAGGTYSVVSICEYGSATGQTVILDTYNAASHGVNKCTCDIRIDSSSNTMTVDKYNNMIPNIPGCGSKVDLEIKYTGRESVTDSMTCFLSSSTYDISESYKISVNWSQDSSTANSKYCIKLSTDSSITVNCEDVLTTTTTISTTTMATTDDPTTIYETTSAESTTHSTTLPTTTLSTSILTTGVTTTLARDTSVPTTTTTPGVTTTDLTSTTSYASTTESTPTTQGMIPTSTIATDTSTIPSFSSSAETRPTITVSTSILTTGVTTTLARDTSVLTTTTTPDDVTTDLTSTVPHTSTTESATTTQGMIPTSTISTDTSTIPSFSSSAETRPETLTTSTILNLLMSSPIIYSTTDKESLSTDATSSTHSLTDLISTDDTSSASTPVDLSSKQTTGEPVTTDDTVTSKYTTITSEISLSTGPDDSTKAPVKLDSLDVIIAAAAAGGGLALIIIVIAIVLICRRGSNTLVQRIDKENLEGAYSIESSNKDGMKENALYVSADAEEEPHSIDDSQKPKQGTDNQYDTVSIEAQEISQPNGTYVESAKAGPIYAAVDKSRKKQTADETPGKSNEEMFSSTTTTINGIEIPNNQSYTFRKDSSNDMHKESKNKDKITEL